jgi:endonuclease/exonuclease/phosphatase family metal-dependent hydrolase
MKSPLFIILSFLFFNSFGQTSLSKEEFNIVFYNVENLFDTYDDTLTMDDEFLPRGDRYWTKKRFDRKVNNIGKVLLSSCEFEAPDIIGLCEIENRFVLEKLVRKSPIKSFDYEIIHKNSPDHRGIDVSMLYRAEKCSPIYFEFIPLRDDEQNIVRTREILYAQFLLQPADTLHLFFCHWPSRYGGQSETEHKRILAAETVKEKLNQLLKDYSNPKIVLMGDFNDNPENKSLSETLGALKTDQKNIPEELINLSSSWKGQGTLKHRQSWMVFDQIIVSDYLLNEKKNWTTSTENATIVNLPFLFKEDAKYQGKKLYRTYYGMRYQGGFSDHLPVRLKLIYSD